MHYFNIKFNFLKTDWTFMFNLLLYSRACAIGHRTISANSGLKSYLSFSLRYFCYSLKFKLLRMQPFELLNATIFLIVLSLLFHYSQICHFVTGVQHIRPQGIKELDPLKGCYQNILGLLCHILKIDPKMVIILGLTH